MFKVVVLKWRVVTQTFYSNDNINELLLHKLIPVHKMIIHTYHNQPASGPTAKVKPVRNVSTQHDPNQV